jgi:shikimate kinase
MTMAATVIVTVITAVTVVVTLAAGALATDTIGVTREGEATVRNAPDGNIVLIGMPASGKSTLGVVLAKILGMRFVDMDIVIQTEQGATLQRLIDELGAEGFIAVENDALARACYENTVIATGGSAVYSEEGMRHLASTGLVVYLHADVEAIRDRLGDTVERGVVFRSSSDHSIESLHAERAPLYERYADVTFDAGDLPLGEAARALADQLRALAI